MKTNKNKSALKHHNEPHKSRIISFHRFKIIAAVLPGTVLTSVKCLRLDWEGGCESVFQNGGTHLFSKHYHNNSSTTLLTVAVYPHDGISVWPLVLNTLRPRQNGRHFPDDIFKWISLNENVWISIKISLKFVPRGPISNIPSLVQIMAWCRPGDKPLSEAMMVSLPTHICVARPQWVNEIDVTRSRYHNLASGPYHVQVSILKILSKITLTLWFKFQHQYFPVVLVISWWWLGV